MLKLMKATAPSALKCSECGSDTVLRIVYGLVTMDYLEANKDRVILGGCEFSEDAPRYECSDCGKQYRHKPSVVG